MAWVKLKYVDNQTIRINWWHDAREVANSFYFRCNVNVGVQGEYLNILHPKLKLSDDAKCPECVQEIMNEVYAVGKALRNAS